MKIKRGKEWSRERGRERACRDCFYFLFFLFFVSFSDLKKSDRRFLSRLKAKLIHVVRAMCGYQNVGVSSNSTRYGIFLLVLFPV